MNIHYIEEKNLDCWEDIKKFVWAGAKDTIKIIEEAEKEDEAIEILEELFGEETPTDIEINDYIWFDLLDDLGIK